MCECEKVKSVNKRVLITSIHYFNMALGKKYYIKKTTSFLSLYFIIIIFGRKLYNKKPHSIF